MTIPHWLWVTLAWTLGVGPVATLLLWGEKDAFIPVAHAADYVRVLPHSTLVTLPGVGHVPQEEAVQQGLAAVQNFLQ